MISSQHKLASQLLTAILPLSSNFGGSHWLCPWHQLKYPFFGKIKIEEHPTYKEDKCRLIILVHNMYVIVHSC